MARHICMCNITAVSRGWRGPDISIQPFPQLQDRIKCMAVFSDRCLSRPVFKRESPTSSGSLFQCFLFFFSFMHTHMHARTHVYLSQKVSWAVSDDLHIKRLVKSFLVARSLLWMMYEPKRSHLDLTLQAELGGPADGVRGANGEGGGNSFLSLLTGQIWSPDKRPTCCFCILRF